MIERVAETLRGSLARLVEPFLVPGALAAGWRLADWETEQGITLRFEGPGRWLSVELEAHDPGRPCFARTARFNLYYKSSDERGLSAGDRGVLDAVLAGARVWEALVPPAAQAPPADRVHVREIEVERALVREGERAYYLNPYVGCLLGCPFCYAIHRAEFSRSLEGLPRAAWGRWIDVKVNAPEVLAREVAAFTPGTVRLSPIVTDPYQPIESRYRVTRRCLEVLVRAGFTPIVLTRSSGVLEDLGLLAGARGGAVGLTVPTDDDAVREAVEPLTEPIADRIATLRAVREAGLRTFGVVQPMLPQDPGRLVELLAPWIQAVRIGPLHEKDRVAGAYVRLGRRDALEPSWEEATGRSLAAGFEARGVLVNPTGAPWSFLG